MYRFMHRECFEVWQDNVLSCISHVKEGGRRCKQMTDKQRVSLLLLLLTPCLPSDHEPVEAGRLPHGCGGLRLSVWRGEAVHEGVAKHGLDTGPPAEGSKLGTSCQGTLRGRVWR